MVLVLAPHSSQVVLFSKYENKYLRPQFAELRADEAQFKFILSKKTQSKSPILPLHVNNWTFMLLRQKAVAYQKGGQPSSHKRKTCAVVIIFSSGVTGKAKHRLPLVTAPLEVDDRHLLDECKKYFLIKTLSTKGTRCTKR